MMKSVLQYLSEKRRAAYHICLCYAENYLMKKAKVGREEDFVEAKRECEILEELITLAEKEGERQ